MSGSMDEGEVLLRQVHPTFVEDGEPTSQCFRPTPKDHNQLSVDRSSMTTPLASYELYVGAGHSSEAVYGLSVAEFVQHGIVCKADPIEPSDNVVANPAHAVADYSELGTSQQKNKSKRLRDRAVTRGRLHPL